MIRKANENDIPQLGELFKQLHEHHIKIAPDSHRMPFDGYFEMEMRSFLEDEKMQIFTEELNGSLTSYAVVNIFDASAQNAHLLRYSTSSISQLRRSIGERAAESGCSSF